MPYGMGGCGWWFIFVVFFIILMSFYVKIMVKLHKMGIPF